MEAPAYPHDTQNLPAYVDSPFLPPPSDSKAAPQSVWIQDTDVSGLYRKRYILPADEVTASLPPEPVFDAVSPPTYSTTPEPLYTVKSHGQPSPLDFRGAQPDFTIYLGDGDSGPVVATGNLHTSALKKSLGEVRFFPRVSSQPGEASSSASKEIPGITLKDKDAGKKYTFTSFGYDFEWLETGPGERPPTPPPPPPPLEEEQPKSTGFFSKLKRKTVLKPAHPQFPPPRDTKTWELTAHDANTGTTTKIATYRELQTIGNAMYTFRAMAPKYPDGHMAKMDIHEPTFEVLGGAGKGARELAVITIMLLAEAQRRKIVNAQSKNWLDPVGGGFSIGGGCGGGS